MSAPMRQSAPVTSALSDCWNQIGVFGNHACERLIRHAHCRHCPVYTAAGRSLLDQPAPPGFAEKWAEMLAGERETEAACLYRVLAFCVGGDQWYALKTEVLQEVMRAAPVQFVPHRTDGLFRGLVNVHGELAPCMSMASIIGGEPLPEERGDVPVRRRMLVVGYGARDRYVCEVESVCGVHPVCEGGLQEAPSTLKKYEKNCVSGILEIEGRPTGLLDEAILLRTFRQLLTRQGGAA